MRTTAAPETTKFRDSRPAIQGVERATVNCRF
jgi:hypothetical protein